MKSKIIWSTFWVVILGVLVFCIYEIAPYLEGKSSISETSEHSEESSDYKESSPNRSEEDQVAASFIEKYHKRLNALTGWGAINSPDWEKVQSISTEIVTKLDAMNDLGDSNLQTDFKAIRETAKELETANNILKRFALIKLHRYLHDLDVVMNGNTGDGAYYEVTKWGEANK